MRVYRITADVNVYQQLYLKDRAYWFEKGQYRLKDPRICLDGTPRENWQPLDLFVLHPKLRVPDFYGYELAGALAVGQKVEDALADFMDVCELLPVNCPGKDLKLVNVLECLECLDMEKSQFIPSAEGPLKNVQPRKYVFHADRFSEQSLFKLPQYAETDIYCWEQEGDPEREFRAAVEHHKLKGLKFGLAWDEEKEVDNSKLWDIY